MNQLKVIELLHHTLIQAEAKNTIAVKKEIRKESIRVCFFCRLFAAIVQIPLTFILFAAGCAAPLRSNDNDTVIIPHVMG